MSGTFDRPLTGMRVLVIDDQKFIRGMIAQGLKGVIPRRNTKSLAHQSPGPRADHRPKPVIGGVRQAAHASHFVGRTGKVWGTVDDRAVEVKQDSRGERLLHAGLRLASM